jgi:hypothetical protein
MMIGRVLVTIITRKKILVEAITVRVRVVRVQTVLALIALAPVVVAVRAAVVDQVVDQHKESLFNYESECAHGDSQDDVSCFAVENNTTDYFTN